MAACAPAVGDGTTNEDTQAASSGLDSDSSESASGGTEGATSEATTSASSAGTGDDEVTAGETGGACDYADPEPGEPLSIAVQNDSEGPLFVQPLGCAAALPYQIASDGEALRTMVDSCAPSTCAGMVALQTCEPTVCPGCPQPPPIRIDPGGRLDGVWERVHYEERALDAECVGLSQCELATCFDGELADDGVYSASVQVFTQCEGDCECLSSPASGGTCSLGFAELSAAVELESSFDLPEATAVELLYAQ